jgi:hypothetical protein
MKKTTNPGFRLKLIPLAMAIAFRYQIDFPKPLRLPFIY